MTSRRVRQALSGLAGAVVAACVLLWAAVTGPPAGPDPTARTEVQVHLTTTSDPGGRHVVKGLEKQPPSASGRAAEARSPSTSRRRTRRSRAAARPSPTPPAG
nr:hypothetical protein [Streptomyces halobius]